MYKVGDNSRQLHSGFQRLAPGASTIIAPAGQQFPKGVLPAGPLRAFAAGPGCGVPRQGVRNRGPSAPALRACSTPQADFSPASLLTLSAPEAARQGRRPAPSGKSSAKAHGEETEAAKRRDSLRLRGKGGPRTTHPSASRVSSTSPSIVASGPGSGPLMVLRPKAVPRSKEPAGNGRRGAKVPAGSQPGLPRSASGPGGTKCSRPGGNWLSGLKSIYVTMLTFKNNNNNK